MPFINSFGAASSRGYGFTRGGGGSTDAVLTAIRAAYGLGAAATSFSQTNDSWTYVDLRSVIGSTKLITVSCAGTRGGGGAQRGGYGATISGTIATNQLAGKIICFVNSYTPPNDSAGGRASSGGGGFSGLIQLDPADYTIGGTLQHFISAAGGGGANGGGDNGNSKTGGDASIYNTSGSPSGGTSLAKDNNGNVGYYPSLSYAGKAGNKYGGGDGANNAQGRDLFVNPGGGGFGPRRGVLSDGSGDPSGYSTGYSMGYGHQTTMGGLDTSKIGAIGGGGCGAEGASGGVPWRVISAGGGGGGWRGGSSGWGGSDGDAAQAAAGISFCGNGASLSSFSGSSSQNGYCNVSWTA
jgi:hypothetical protein